MKKELYLEAIQLFGKEIVGQVISMVYISDADGMY